LFLFHVVFIVILILVILFYVLKTIDSRLKHLSGHYDVAASEVASDLHQKTSHGENIVWMTCT
jgi:predicted Holliday junction resolvase-like endonuclease